VYKDLGHAKVYIKTNLDKGASNTNIFAYERTSIYIVHCISHLRKTDFDSKDLNNTQTDLKRHYVRKKMGRYQRKTARKL
jgi:hypothetical protein